MRDERGSRLEERIMAEIHSGRARIRSRFALLVERLGYDGLALVVILAAAAAALLIGFWVRSVDVIGLVQFGPLGFRMIVEAFPYEWLLTGVGALVGIAWFVRQTDWSTRTTSIVAGSVLIVLVGIGTAAAASTWVDRLAGATQLTSVPGRAVNRLVTHHGTVGLIGDVVGTAPQMIQVRVSGQTIAVVLNDRTALPSLGALTVGDRIVVVGPTASGSRIQATGVRRLKPAPWRVILPRLTVPHPRSI
jgi:hypothetical protein